MKILTTDFSFIASGSERTFTFRVPLNALPTLATLVRENVLRRLSLPNTAILTIRDCVELDC